jgi:integrase
MLLQQLTDDYKTIRNLAPGSAYLMRRTVALLTEYLEREATTGDLDDLTISRWLEHLERSSSEWTRTGHRTRLLCLWRYAARRQLAPAPGEVRRCPAPEPMPEAWTSDQVTQLVRACGNLNTKAAAYFRALILAAYESGLRRSDLRALEREQIGPDGLIQLRQHKTRAPHVVAVRPETAAAVLALPGECPLASPYSTGRYGHYWTRLCQMADISHGGCQQLRRTGATLVAVDHGEDAARAWLGHRTAEMVRHYCDRRLTQPRPWLPPRVG